MPITDCNKLITLGSLDSFISGLIQDSNGTVLSVNYKGKQATYCPTYSELTGGTYIQASVQNANSPTLDIDGIVVNGAYTSTQNVTQGDLKVRYTRFDSLVATTTPSTADSCNESTVTLGYTLKYKRYEKTYGGECTTTTTSSTDVNDNVASISWTSNPTSAGTISYPNFVINPIGGDGGTQNITVTASVQFRGSNKTASTVVNQSGTCCGCNDFELSPSQLSWGATETGIKPISITKSGTCINDVTLSITGTNASNFSATTDGSSINVKPTSENISASERTATLVVGYKVGGTSCSNKTVILTQGSLSCDCASAFILSPTSVEFEASSTASTLVSGTPTDCFVSSSITAASTSHFNVTVDNSTNKITISPNTTNTNVTDIIETINVSYKMVGGTCNNAKQITATHKGRACNCNDFGITSSLIEFESGDTTTTKYAEYSANTNCNLSITSVSTNQTWVSAGTVDTTNKQIPIKATTVNTGPSRDATVTVNYKFGSTTCSKTFTVRQKGSCACGSNLTFTPSTSQPVAWNSTNSFTITASSNTCVSGAISASTTSTHFSVSRSGSSNNVFIVSHGQNTTHSEISADIKFSYKLAEGGTTCTDSETFTVKQAAKPCDCDDINITEITS